MSEQDERSDDECEYTLELSDDEIHAGVWLVRTLEMICKHKKANADKAAVARKLLHRQARHMAELHRRVHELEDEVALMSWSARGNAPGSRAVN